MGIWNSHTSVGNMLGSLIASGALEFGWGWSFLLPGLVIIFFGFLVLAFLAVNPKDLGYEVAVMEIEMNGSAELEDASLLASGLDSDLDSDAAIGFLEAWKLPGVAPYAFSLFFSKLVAYTFLYWLPFYIRNTGMKFC